MDAMSTPPADSTLPPDDATADERGDVGRGASCPVVGVGASAGGLEAFTQLLSALPADTGMAYVLVQHLAPTHASALAEILSRATEMPVMEVHDEPTVQPNQVYVIPPGRNIVIARGALQLLPREGRGQVRAVDQFFRSLAEDSRHRAIGVVLSGTATDGTLGLEAIKAEGGITFAQDRSAQHEGMPHSAIASGCVDFVLPPDEIAREIVRIGQHGFALQEPPQTFDRPDLAPVVQCLHDATGVDFSNYKFNTLYRRVTRRMLLRKIARVLDYVKMLRETPGEAEALYQDILIGVTRFFRDPEAFEALKKIVFPRLVKDRSRHDPVRVWTIGCSTGEEAYSLAIAYTEFAEAAGNSVPRLQVFATDLSAVGIEKARAGIYSKDIAQDVSPERLRRFFADVDGSYRIIKTIRDACVFSRHNLTADPPFSRIDLISCRNLLIYLEPALQQKVMPTLHYALKPAGFLWLGNSETIGSQRNLFEAEDLKHKIFIKKPGSSAGHGHFPLQQGGEPRPLSISSTARAGDVPMDLHREADRILSTRFAPPGVLVSADLEILQYRGDTGMYLAPAPGKASLNLLKMLREGLLVPVRAAVLKAGKDASPIREEGLRVKSNGGYHEFAVEVLPVKGHGTNETGFLILFEEPGTAGVVDHPTPKENHADSSTEPDNARLTQELAATREYLQSIIEQQETVNEELQSANEEAQSANEELQSTNEELETSKEEIQSSNEELATVNDELNNRNAELTRANNDLVNLLGSVQMPIVMLGPDFRVRRFTPAAEKILNLVPTDVGRSLTELKLNVDNLPRLEPLLTEVLDTVGIKECEVRDRQGRWYLLRLRPYKTLDNKIDGVVMLLVDMDAVKRAQVYTENIVSTVREPLVVLDASLRVQTASRAFYEIFHVTPEGTENRPLHELGNGQWDIPELRRLLGQVLPRDDQVSDFEVQHEFEQIGTRTMMLNARRLIQAPDCPPLILLAIEDITQRKQAEASLAEADRRKNEFLAMLAHELRNPLAPIRNALHILRLGETDHEAIRSASATMERQVAQMVRLVDDLLDVSRISRGKIDLRRGRIELASVVHHAAEASRPAMTAAEQDLTISLPPEPVYLMADPIRLAQVVGNLLNNACKFTDKGGRISLAAALEGGEAVIRVKDNGIGIAADQLHRIFDMFMQVDTSLERSVSGLGIGLSLVKNVVELHGGNVEAHSAGAGQGSEFVIRLPVLLDGVQPRVATTVGEPPPPTLRRVLVVDDNRDSADSLALLFRLTGNETRTACDGLEAFKAAATFRPEVILLDIGLPKMNGYEACRRIREQPWGKSMILVALTGWGQTEDRQKSKDAGFDGHLVKPVDYAALMVLLAELLPTPVPASEASPVGSRAERDE